MMKYTSPIRNRIEEYGRNAPELVDTSSDATERPGVEQPGVDRPGAATGYREIPLETTFLPYGSLQEDGLPICEILASCGVVETEYASLRRAVGVMDVLNRTTLMVTGEDRRDFLNRMVTQELKDLAPGEVREGFLINRKGRLEADLRIAEFGGFIMIDVDVLQAQRVVEILEGFLFVDDVQIELTGDRFHHLELHGPQSLELVGRVVDTKSFTLEPGRAVSLALDETSELFVMRVDQIGEIGLILIAPRGKVENIWTTLLQADDLLQGGKRRIRPVGWNAFNIARIEAGLPLMNIDFDTTNIPHETGLVERRVSFTKGCYPGQEIVARVQNLGQPKQTLFGIKINEEHLPIAGAQVYEGADQTSATPIGMITSSTLSPMLGAVPIAFGLLKTAKAELGAQVLVEAEGESVPATVQSLQFLANSSTTAVSS